MEDLTVSKVLNTSLGGFTVGHILSAILTLLVCLVVVRLVMKLVTRLLGRAQKLNERLQKIIRTAVKAVLYLLTAIITAGALGINTTSLTALMSVVTLGVTLAAEDILGNVAGGLVILSSHPFSIGDTITTPGKKFRFAGIPTFPPEHFSRVSPKDTMKRKQFVKGTEQIAQEGAIQIFKVPGSGFEEVIVGVVGTLQFDVFQYRMKNEYGVDLRMDMLPYEEIRLIDEYPGDLSDLNLGSDAELLEDYRGRSLLVFSSFWAIDFTCRRNPGLKVSEIVVAEG